jgi:hypothetical protein
MKSPAIVVEWGNSAVLNPSSNSELIPVSYFGESPDAIPPHPQGIKPWGNRYVATRNARDAIGTFRILPDEVLVILLEYLDSASLRLLGSTCQAFYAFCCSDELWKALFIE